jgi:hypothetical protein
MGPNVEVKQPSGRFSTASSPIGRFPIPAGAPGSLLSDTTFCGFRQALADVASGEADVFQFSIVKLTKECNIRRARPAREFGGDPAVDEVTQAGHSESKRSPDC